MDLYRIDDLDGVRPVPGFPEYWATPEGHVYTRFGLGLGPMLPAGMARRMGAGRTKYPKVVLRNGDTRRWVGVHEVILETFVGPCPEGMECRHLDGNKRNSRRDNLCWGTRDENAQDRVRHGTQARGSSHGRSELSETQVIEIRRLARSGMPYAALSERFGPSPSHIRRIVVGDFWKHLNESELADEHRNTPAPVVETDPAAGYPAVPAAAGEAEFA